MIIIIIVTNTCEIVRGKSDAAFRLGQETVQRPFRIYQIIITIIIIGMNYI